MGYDPMGTWNWNTFFSGVRLLAIGIGAIAVAWPILTCSGTGMLMALVASYTIVAGSITAANGAAEIIEAATDFNPVRDTIFMGSEEAYEGIKNIFKAHAEIGTMICGAYIAVNGGSVCFVAGTLVSTETGQIPIEEVEPGMLVWATDPVTGETALKPVVQTFVNQTNELVHVTVNGETITCTNEHPFYSPVKGWMAACQLRAGDVLVMLNGEYVVVEQVQHELLESPVAVYNFEVADLHTYYVGDTEVLVHNSCEQKHHVMTNKNKKYTPEFKKIADKYDLDLNSADNIISVENHRGRHTNKYHEFILDEVQSYDAMARGDRKIFMREFDKLKRYVHDNTGVMYMK